MSTMSPQGRKGPAEPAARLIPIAGLSEAEIAAWGRLASAAIEPNPFFEPDFVLPAARHTTDRDVSLLVVEDEAGWRACLPVVRDRYRRVAPVLAGWRGPHGYLGTPLVAGGDPAEAMRALLRLGRSAAGPLRLLMIDRTAADGRVFAALEEAIEATNLTIVIDVAVGERAFMKRRDEPGDYTASVGRNHRHKLRQKGRRLAERTGAPIEITDRAGDVAAVERFLDLEESGWKGHAQTSMRSEHHAVFFRQVCETYAAQGRLELLDLHCGERSIAMKCNLRSGAGTFAFKIAFDEEFGRFSPGEQLELANIEVFHAGGSEWMDSCANPKREWINRLWPDRRSIRTMLLAPRGPRAAAARLGLATPLRWRDRVTRRRTDAPR